MIISSFEDGMKRLEKNFQLPLVEVRQIIADMLVFNPSHDFTAIAERYGVLLNMRSREHQVTSWGINRSDFGVVVVSDVVKALSLENWRARRTLDLFEYKLFKLDLLRALSVRKKTKGYIFQIRTLQTKGGNDYQYSMASEGIRHACDTHIAWCADLSRRSFRCFAPTYMK